MILWDTGAKGETHERLRDQPLEPETWNAFADLAERHNGVWNGCWCTWFHPSCPERGQSSEGNRAIKQRLINEGRAHAALVFDGDKAVAWCEYGTPEELPNIYHRKEYEATVDRLPDYRLTCFFVDRARREQRPPTRSLSASATDGVSRRRAAVQEHRDRV